MDETKNLLSPDDIGIDKQLHYERSLQLGTFKDPKRREELLGILNTTKTQRRDVIVGVEKSMRSSGKAMVGCNPGAPKILLSFLEDWLYLALLGCIMALCSLIMDIAIEKLQYVHIFLFDLVSSYEILTLSYAVWVLYVIILISGSALFVHYVAPQAIGSGIPEMKTILRGVVLKEYLTLRTLISKMIGLMLSLGSGVPMGKEGPFVHVASVVANLLSNLKHGKSKVFENEVNNNEMLAAGCAVGVACTFAAPIGGVLFSIEVTAVYFAVRNYWRGFFAAIVSASLFRLFKLIQNSTGDVLTVQAHFQTRFPVTEAFLLEEVPLFIVLGVICGILGAIFVFLHRWFVLFLRRSTVIKKVFMKYWIVYPIVVAFIISSITFPMGAGGYLGGEQKFTETLSELFANCTLLTEKSARRCKEEMITHWTNGNQTTAFITLPLFFGVFYFLSLLSSTLPVPSGIFMPVFVLGASVGRFMGEVLAYNFPDGFEPSKLHENGDRYIIRPGAYAVVGAAAMCGAVTHTVSIVVIVLELTGQLALLLPVMIAVLVANGVCSCLQPSIYDSIIKMKHLPYLPDISHSSSIFHQISAVQVMNTPVRFVAKDSTYGELQETLLSMPTLRAFPLADSKNRKALIGSISRQQLMKLVEGHVGIKARQAEARRRVQEAINNVDVRMKKGQRSPVTTVQDLFETRSKEEKDTPKKKFTISKVDRQNIHEENDEVKEAIFAMGVKRHVIKELEDLQKKEEAEGTGGGYHTIGGMFRSLTRKSLGKKKPHKDEFDLHDEERQEWEQKILNETVDLTNCNVDTSPFQIDEQTSLFKVHSLFSLLGLHRAYVSCMGRLVGVISLKELRAALELIFSGKFPAFGESMVVHFVAEETEEHEFIQPTLEVLKGQSTETLIDDTERVKSPSSDPGFSLNVRDTTILMEDESAAVKKRKKPIHIRITEPGE